MDTSEKELRNAISWILLTVTTLVYWQVCRHQFINYDDSAFVWLNSRANTGLTPSNLAWAFTTLNGGTSYYHPITWITYQIDTQIFGLNPGAIHLSNLLFHLANTWLLLRLLHSLTGRLWRSAMVAALFALHPLHVETVCWASERKSLVCTFFWMLTLLAYTRYARRPAFWRYGLVLLGFAASLMGKPMAVSLPFVLLLLDFWPLGRLRLPERGLQSDGEAATSLHAGEAPAPPRADRYMFLRQFTPLVIEKTPLLAMSAFISWLTVVAQSDLGAVASLGALPLLGRLANTAVAYTEYVGRVFWPRNLAPIYPLPASWPWWEALGGALAILTLTLFTFRQARSRPYLLVGWLWFLGTLVPMIGLVQVGSQAMADRYTYVSFIGLFIVLVWGVAEWSVDQPRLESTLPAVATVVLLLCVTLSGIQASQWSNSVRLFQHAASVTDGNYIAMDTLGLAYCNADNTSMSKKILGQALGINPRQARVLASLGHMASVEGDHRQAIYLFDKALEMDPKEKQVHTDLALFYESAPDAALRNFSKAMEHARLACEVTRYADRGDYLLLAETCANAKHYPEARAAARKVFDLSVSPRERSEAERVIHELVKLDLPTKTQETTTNTNAVKL